MDLLDLRDYCLSLPATEETTPFDETTLVYKVGGKMFALTDMVDYGWVSLKCDPSYAEELREQYEEITPAYHMNKKHWNSIKCDGDLPASLIKEQILNSYLLVVQGMPRKQREEIMELYNNYSE